MYLKVLFISLLSFSAFAQVGIGTTNPTASLDVNGDLRVRSMSQEFVESTIRDSILVISNTGIIRRVESKQILETVLKSAVKGKFSTASLINLTLLSSEVLLPFNDENFDTNDEFDTATSSFVAKQDGIYSIYAQIKAGPLVSVSTNFGISVFKNNVLEATNSFANVSAIGINVTPPIRSVNTLVSLNAGDSITFKITGALASVDVIGDSVNSYFTIHQVR